MTRKRIAPLALLLLALPVLSFAQSGAARRTTTLNITVSANVQGATVSVDDKQVGTTPATVALAAGDHTLSVTAGGYAPYTGKFTVSKEETLTITLTPLAVQVSLASNVQGADVAIGTAGKPMQAKIPAAVQLLPGSYDVSVTAAGFKPYAGKISVTMDAKQTFTFQLEAATVKVQLTTNVPASIAITGGANVNLQAKSPATVDLMPAQYNVTLNAPGYQQLAATMAVDPKGVDPKAGMQIFNFVLQPAMSTLVLPAQYLEGDVQFVKVYLDGKLMNAQIAVKGSIQVPPGKHKVRLASAPAGLATEAEFDFAAGQSYEMRLQLQFVVPGK